MENFEYIEAVSADELKTKLLSVPKTHEVISFYSVGGRHFVWVKKKHEHKKEK